MGYICIDSPFFKLSGEGDELNIAKRFYETIQKLILPYIVFLDNISSEEVGYFQQITYYLYSLFILS